MLLFFVLDAQRCVMVDEAYEVRRVFTTREALEEAAQEIAARASPDSQYTVYLYFISRYLVVVYEARFAAIPMQVWNEYRNAFDHYVRSITKLEDDVTDNMKKLEGHIQRAVLDMCKLLCHRGLDALKAEEKAEKREALRFVDNGRFFPVWQEEFAIAEKKFEAAKIHDLSLGADAKNNCSVLSSYLDAYYATVAADQLWDSKRLDIQNATNQVNDIAAQAAHQSSVDHVRDSLLAKVIWGGGALLLFVIWEMTTTDVPVVEKFVKLSGSLSKLWHSLVSLFS